MRQAISALATAAERRRDKDGGYTSHFNLVSPQLTITTTKATKATTTTMNTLTIFVSSLAVLASASRPQRALNSRSSSSGPAAVDATYDGSCFYPKPTEDFVLQDYLGRWYQAASTTFGPTTGCECVFADYALNVSTLPSYFMTFVQEKKSRTNGVYSHSANMIRFFF